MNGSRAAREFVGRGELVRVVGSLSLHAVNSMSLSELDHVDRIEGRRSTPGYDWSCADSL